MSSDRNNQQYEGADDPEAGAEREIGVDVPDPGFAGRVLQEDGPAKLGGFDPTPYLRQLRGRGGGDYLDVKWRLLWLRKEHPDAEIVTEMVEHDPQMAIFKATVTIPTGGKATGYGSETASDFPDFIEKAETKAIGRALNALGYGVQFSDRAEEMAAQAQPQRPPADQQRPQQQPQPSPGPVALPRQQESPRPEPKREARAAAPREAAPPPPSTAPSPAASDAELVEYSWSAFWPWARDRGLNGPRAIEMLINRPVAGLSPAELRDLVIAADTRRS